MGYWFIKGVLAPVLRLFFRPTAYGLGNVPLDLSLDLPPDLRAAVPDLRRPV